MSTELPESTEVEGKKSPWIKTGEPGLYTHLPTNKYYSRYRLNGKRTWISLDTDVYTVAKLRHKTKMKEIEEQRQAGKPTTSMRTMGDLLNHAKTAVLNATLSDSSKRVYKMRFEQLEKCWPAGDIHKFAPARVTDATVTNLRDALSENLGPASVNQVLQTFGTLMEDARRLHLAVYNPLSERRNRDRILARVEYRKPNLPTKEMMLRVFDALEESDRNHFLGAEYSEFLHQQALNSAEHARFLAFSGMRLEEGNATRWEDITTDRIHVGGTKTDTSDRWIPIVPDMAKLLVSMRERRAALGIPTTGPILLTSISKKRMVKACERLGIPPLRHHDLRHFFATICIESGVDIPTVSRWLGHADGGALAMKTYGHLRDEHSAASAAKVSFGSSVPATAG